MMDNNPRSRLSDLKYPEVVMSSALLNFTLMLVSMRSLVAISSEVAADSSSGVLSAASFLLEVTCSIIPLILAMFASYCLATSALGKVSNLMASRAPCSRIRRMPRLSWEMPTLISPGLKYAK